MRGMRPPRAVRIDHGKGRRQNPCRCFNDPFFADVLKRNVDYDELLSDEHLQQREGTLESEKHVNSQSDKENVLIEGLNSTNHGSRNGYGSAEGRISRELKGRTTTKPNN